MPKKTIAAVLLFASALINPSTANSQDSKYLSIKRQHGIVKYAHVITDDQVKDNCWTNVSTIKSKTILALTQNNIEVFDYMPGYTNAQSPTIALKVFGYRVTNTICIGSAELEVSYSSSIHHEQDGRTSYYLGHDVNSFKRAGIYSNGKTLNTQLDDFFEGGIAEYITSVIQYRKDDLVQQFLLDFPAYNNKPEALKQ